MRLAVAVCGEEADADDDLGTVGVLEWLLVRVSVLLAVALTPPADNDSVNDSEALSVESVVEILAASVRDTDVDSQFVALKVLEADNV